MAETEIIVPVELDALLVNKGVLARDGFRRWQYDYTALAKFHSPEPLAGERNIGGMQAGVYLHWTLPRSLRHGVQRQGEGISYPLVPNRWLIVRLSGQEQRKAAAWVLESDCPYTAHVKDVGTEQTSMYLADSDLIRMWQSSPDPYRSSISLTPDADKPQVANIGIPFPLDPGWSERAADAMFLTAVAPGNSLFASYVPHNAGVFSFYDDLAGISQDTLSYQVIGWYSDPAKDIMASWKESAGSSSDEAYASLLDQLEWTYKGCGDQTSPKGSVSLYEGMVFGLVWDRDGEPPKDDPLNAIREAGNLNVAVGNTTADAFSALLSVQLAAKGYDTRTIPLLRALQYDMLPALNEVNGDVLLMNRIHGSWFGSKSGGYSWAIVQSASGEGAEAELTPEEAAWLSQLNADQAELDESLQALYRLQWELNGLWLKRGLDPDSMWPSSPPGVTNAKLDQELDPANPDSKAGQAAALLRKAAGLLAKVPGPLTGEMGTAQEAYQKGIQFFAKKKGLGSGKMLLAKAAPRFWLANNPVVVLSGVEPPTAFDPDKSLVVRLPEEIISGFHVNGKPVDSRTARSAVPKLSTGALPAVVPQLLEEFVFLDPASAAALAGACGIPEADVLAVINKRSTSDYTGTLPAPAALWRQPWNPMLMEWKVNYTHVPYLNGQTRNWIFDGREYKYSSAAVQASQVENRDIGGISLLSPHAQLIFGSKLKDFIQHYDDDHQLTDLYNEIGSVSGWKYLAQELTGFQDMIALRDGRAFRRPIPKDMLGTGPVQVAAGQLMGYEDMSVLPGPYSGQIHHVPFLPNGTTPGFHGTRQGEMYFEELLLYDKFGRVLQVIASGKGSGLYNAQNFPLLKDQAMSGNNKINKQIASVASLPPRLLQHARLNARLVDGMSSSKSAAAAERSALASANPVCGWVIANHLDHSLLLYSPEGLALGEYRLLVDGQGNRSGEWLAPPHNEVAALDDVARLAPHIYQMITSPQLAEEANFNAFLRAIDSTLWTVDPLGNRDDQNLTVLIGRPLALVRMCLQLQLEGPPIRDAGWGATFDTADPDFVDFPFDVRLGDLETRQDGVIGYFLEDDYSTFNSSADPEEEESDLPQSYLRHIGADLTNGTKNYLQLKFQAGSEAFVSLLVDPRAAIHVSTGILPVKEVTIPSAFTDQALSSMETTFRVGPLLSRIIQTPAQAEKPPVFPLAVRYPSPVEQNGSWSWWERSSDKDWNGYELLSAGDEARLESGAVTLRDGVLQLAIKLSDHQSNTPNKE
ncbi:hypothetical protein [Paenibacillus sp. J22TS3]|uniref:hypothetical protein n=1 Tax=Paenibacillus sp. J22TS3 TaxID=2807192 RepID=UPI001B0B72C7|nr:hypothetical protein [Paenibacillus sp. J22TS3]GIP23380.1 hypothetical protein J22TS3_36550 [Paenibacillus sp. J22TS3]